MFKIYLKYVGFSNYRDGGGVDRFRYTEFHGSVDYADRVDNLIEFNKIDNINGEKIRIILISAAGAEGLSLSNVRSVHIIEPYWHSLRINQLEARAIRMCSHRDLPMSERHVDVFRYKALKQNGEKTVDFYIEGLAKNKERLIDSFLTAIKEAAIDCELNKSYNMLTNNYKCFKFNEPSLFEQQIGPAYKEDINDDAKIDDGSNSVNSITTRIKIIKIRAVTLLSPPEEVPPRYSSPPEYYWLYPKSGTVYDFEQQFPIGRIGYDPSNNLPQKLDKDTYIITHLIPIPII
jgi:hypothetical protein